MKCSKRFSILTSITMIRKMENTLIIKSKIFKNHYKFVTSFIFKSSHNNKFFCLLKIEHFIFRISICYFLSSNSFFIYWRKSICIIIYCPKRKQIMFYIYHHIFFINICHSINNIIFKITKRSITLKMSIILYFI